MNTTTLQKNEIQQTGSISLLQRLWSSRWAGALVAVGVAALAGIIVGMLMPRGPVTTGQALTVMGVSLGTGLVAGFGMRSRWALLLAPAAHAAAFELTRLDAVGPTVDAIRLDTTFGILAFLLGRGFHGLIGLLPMILAAGLGVGLARRFSGVDDGASRRSGLIRRTAVLLLWIGVIALAVLIAWPASTPPIVGSNGEPLPGSVAELTTVELGGLEQTIMVRGASTENPVLLYLSGGPGQSDLGYGRVLLGDLEEDFVVVVWEQRGVGYSYPALEPTATLTLDQAVSDTIELTNYLRRRFDEEKIYLLGESWGTTLGVLAVQEAPELFHAYLGSGQMVSQRITDQMIYADLVALAERTGDSELEAQMRGYGEPPYEDIPYANGFVMAHYEALEEPYTPPRAYIERGESSGVGFWGLMASEYSVMGKVNALRGLLDMFTLLYPQIQHVDFRQDVPRLEVPVYILDGEQELAGRRNLALEWYEQLEAPSKRLYTFENAGHAVAFEQFEAFHQIMTETVVPETYTAR